MKALIEILREYYSRANLVVPPDLELREIAMQPWNLGTYIRHLSASSIDELRRLILDKVPKHIYFSSARYREPANPDMNLKGWLGSDLVFDIDSDHLPQCREKVVEFRFCPRCGYVASENEEKCPRCGSALEEFNHVDSECVELAWNEVVKLLEVLKMDFGYQTFTIAFSGNRGFHVQVHLDGEEALLPSDARREIVDYLKLASFSIDETVVTERKLGRRRVMKLPPSRFDVGVRRRIYAELKRGGIDTDRLILSYSLLRSKSSEINAAITEAVERARIEVDEKVTIDISRLVRIPNSINGKSGWIAFHITNTSSFELSEDKVSPIKEEIKVRMLVDMPRIKILDYEIRARRGEILKLSPAVALYLVFKGVAQFVTLKR